MRILYITDALAVWGGIERVLRDKTNFLVERYGYDVFIVTTDQGSHSIPYPLDERVHIKDLDVCYHHQYRFRGLKRILKFREKRILFRTRLENYIKEISPDVIVCIRIESIQTILRAKGNIPVICESHSMFYSYRYEKTSFWNRLNLYYLRKQLYKVNSIVALTEGDAKDWRKHNEHVYVIPNVVQLNPLKRNSKLDSKIIIFVGRFSQQKDFGTLIDVWRIVQQRHKDWELHAYGEGELRCHYEKVVADENLNIRMFPPTSNIFEKYVGSSMLVMTSRYEPFGLVLPEAMSCGLPVVAFNCPYGPADIIKNGENGFLIDNRNIGEFALCVNRLIEDRMLRLKMGECAIISAQRYRSETIMPLWKSLFEKYSDIRG